MKTVLFFINFFIVQCDPYYFYYYYEFKSIINNKVLCIEKIQSFCQILTSGHIYTSLNLALAFRDRFCFYFSREYFSKVIKL